MLAAVNKHGHTVVLAGPGAKSSARQLKSEPHFCPQCGSPVVVKAGDILIPHFAHASSLACESFSEPESPRHLAGKSHLFQWITDQGAQAYLEARLPGGTQRPDILAGNIAVEYQCSSIPASLFKERSDKYKDQALKPLWIYGGRPVEPRGRYIKLTSFQRLFIRFHPQLGSYFLSYCPDQKQFTLYDRIVPVTPTLCTAGSRVIPLARMAFPPAAAEKSGSSFQLKLFFNEKRKWINQMLAFRQARQHPFFQAVYASGRNPYLLPDQIGLPVQSSLALRNHPVEWQFYLFSDQTGRPVQEVIRNRIEMGHLKEQPLPLAGQVTAEQAAAEYEQLVKQLGLPEKDSGSMGAKLEQESAFIDRYGAAVLNKLIF